MIHVEIITTCAVEITQYALKGQKLLAQGDALGDYGRQPVALKGQKHCKRVRDASIYASKKYRSSFYS